MFPRREGNQNYLRVKKKKKTEILKQGLLSCVNKGRQVVKNKQNYPK